MAEIVSQSTRTADAIRVDIDKIDEELRLAVERRIQLGLEIGAVKESAGQDIIDADRERQVVDGYAVWAEEADIPVGFAKGLGSQVVEITRAAQQRQLAQLGAATLQ